MRAERARQRTEGETSASGEIDLTLFMTLKEVKNLAEPDKEKLRAVVRKFHVQKKFSRFHGQHPGTASLGQLRTWQEEKKRNIMREQVWDQVPEFADPMPSAAEFISGIPHKNSDPKNKDQFWAVERAFASNKMHYYTKLRRQMLGETEASADWPFLQAFPDLSPASGGMNPLTDDAWNLLKEEMGLQNYADYLKHILTKHEGEAKLAVDLGWVPLHENHHKACFWSYQFVADLEV